MTELSIFVDESGDQAGSRSHLITLTFRDQKTAFCCHEWKIQKYLPQ